MSELPHHAAKGFVNPHLKQIRRSILDHILWCTGWYKDQIPLTAVPEDFAYPNPKMVVDREEPTLTWINHSTFLMVVDGCAFLTDPIWNGRCSPLKWAGPCRRKEAPFEITELPPLDYILISHDHYDHLDKKSVRKLTRSQPDMTWFVPLNLGKWLKKQGVRRVVELDWWQSHTARTLSDVNPEVKVTAVPSQHYSGRGLFSKNQSLWCGYVVEITRPSGEHRRFYFVGDTGYNPHDFVEVGKRFGEMDLSLVPIGVYRPREFMQTVHVNPEEAVQIHLDACSKLSVGGHFGTFKLSSEPDEMPPYDLYQALLAQGLDPSVFRVLDQGQTINW
jgi:N-acyl-phosphatidylethanolamine-hydrolysing phospholipase D